MAEKTSAADRRREFCTWEKYINSITFSLSPSLHPPFFILPCRNASTLLYYGKREEKGIIFSFDGRKQELWRRNPPPPPLTGDKEFWRIAVFRMNIHCWGMHLFELRLEWKKKRNIRFHCLFLGALSSRYKYILYGVFLQINTTIFLQWIIFIQ